jgi:hypothetical protein
VNADFQQPASGAAPDMGSLTHHVVEQSCEVRLIAHATAHCDGTKRFGRCQHELLGHLDTPAQHVVAWCNSMRASERSAEVA